MGGPNKEECAHIEDYVEQIRISQEHAYSLAQDQLNKSAERDMRVRPEQFFVGTWVLYYSPRRYVGRSHEWKRNYSGPFLITKRHSPVTVSIQISQNSDALVVHTDKLKLFLVNPRRWLNEIDRSSDSLEMGTILDPESPGCARIPVPPISDD